MSRRAAFALSIAFLCCLAAVVAAGFWGYSYDDAFITYRYAQTWLEQGVLRYNLHEPVLGTSAPGYALLLGVAGRLSAPLGITVPQWGTTISVASLLGIALAPLAVRREGEPLDRSVLVLCFGVLALCLRWNVELLGNELFPGVALVVAGGLLLFERERTSAAGLVLSCAALLRFELLLAALAFGALWTWRRRRLPIGFLVALLVPLILYLALLYLHFGRVVPQTLAVRRYGFSLVDPDYTAAQWRWLRRTLPLPGCLALLGLGLAGLVATFARSPRARPLIVALVLWLAAHEATYRLLGIPFTPWYHLPTLLALAFFAVLAAQHGAAALVRAVGEQANAAVRGGIVLLLLAPLLVPSIAYVASQWGRPPDPRFRTYAKVSHFLRDNSEPDALVAAVEIGVLGYESRRPLLDLVGLVSPEALRARRDGRLADLLFATAPRYVVIAAKFTEPLHAFLRHDGVVKRYRLVRRFENPELGESTELFERRDAGESRR